MINSELKILILQRILPHYRAGFFHRLQDEFPSLRIFYGNPYPGESLKNQVNPDENIFSFAENIYIGKSRNIFMSGIYSKIFQIRPDVIISVFNSGNLNLYFLLILRFFLKFKLILWSFGYDPVRGYNPDNSFKDKLRLFLSDRADAVIFYWNKGKMEAEKFSKKSEHFFVAPNTLDTDRQLEIKKMLDSRGKDSIKEELGVKEKFHFVYTGRFLKDKQIDFLLRAFAEIEQRYENVRLTLIGDGPEYSNLEKLCTELNLKKVFFTGEILDEESTGKWIYISDAFLIPGRLGLSVVHSFCFGTPVISQNKESYFHGEGVGYIKDGINGYLTEDGNLNDFAGKIIRLISDSEHSASVRKNSLKTIEEECSVGKMKEGFRNAIVYAINKRNKPGK